MQNSGCSLQLVELIPLLPKRIKKQESSVVEPLAKLWLLYSISEFLHNFISEIIPCNFLVAIFRSLTPSLLGKNSQLDRFLVMWKLFISRLLCEVTVEEVIVYC